MPPAPPTPTIGIMFDKLLSASQIEEQLKLGLQKWFPTYLREVERQLALIPKTLDTPHNYSDRNSFDAEAGEALPKIVVIAPGTIGTPRKSGDGKISATWRVGVGVACAASTEEDANRNLKAYAAAIRGIVLQNSGLSVLKATDVTWVEESYIDLPVPDRIELFRAASIYFDVDIDNVITKWAGPDKPDLPPENYVFPTVDVVDINTQIVEVVS